MNVEFFVFRHIERRDNCGLGENQRLNEPFELVPPKIHPQAINQTSLPITKM